MATIDREKSLKTMRKHYSKAPITEAIIDIRVNCSDKRAINDILQDCQSLPGYPQKNELHLVTKEFSLGEDQPSTSRRVHYGRRFTSEDNLQIVQFKSDGFAFSRLWPYENWETFRSEAQKLWQLYVSYFQVENVNRLAVRYVNRLDLPLPFDNFTQFLRTVPELSSDMPQGLSHYVMRLESPQDEIGAMLFLTQTMLPADTPNPSKISIVLDLDLFRNENFGKNEDVIWDYFEKLHLQENMLFEACITDRMREEIQ